jgi:hypothetical protein
MSKLSALALSFSFLGLAAAAHAAPAGGTEVKLDTFKSVAPKGWKDVPTTSSMRVKQFSIPRAAGDSADAELIIFYFGPGQGGGLEDNVTRWKGFFKAPEGKTIDQVSKREGAKYGPIKASILDIRGTYLYKPMPMAPTSEERPNHRMIAMMLETPNGPYFLRFVGPEKTITQNMKVFEGWLKAFK